MKERFIDRFEVILLDMGRTFMFGVDRFDRSDDFETSYRNAGGGTLNANEVFKIVSTILKVMIDDGKNPAKYENFPSVKSCLDTQAVSCDLGDDEKKITAVILIQQIVCQQGKNNFYLYFQIVIWGSVFLIQPVCV